MVKKEETTWGKRVIILIFLILFVISFGVLGFYLTTGHNIKESFILTLEVLSFTYEEELLGLAKIVKICLALFGVIFFWLALWESFDIALESNFINHFGEGNMKQIKKLKDHYIICGGGRVGYHIVKLLNSNKQKVVIIDKDEFAINQLKKKGFLVFEGDCLEEETLKEVNISKAKALIAVLPESEKNILITLSARELSKSIKIYARSNKSEYTKKMIKAGANFVVTPELSCAEEIFSLCNKNKK